MATYHAQRRLRGEKQWVQVLTFPDERLDEAEAYIKWVRQRDILTHEWQLVLVSPYPPTHSPRRAEYYDRRRAAKRQADKLKGAEIVRNKPYMGWANK